MKKRRKAPIVLISALVVLLGGVFIVNVLSHRAESDSTYAQNDDKDPGKATGNDAKAISKDQIQQNVAAALKSPSDGSKDPTKKKKRSKLEGIGDPDADLHRGPMVLRDKDDQRSRFAKPNYAPDNGNAAGQWYSNDAGLSKR